MQKELEVLSKRESQDEPKKISRDQQRWCERWLAETVGKQRLKLRDAHDGYGHSTWLDCWRLVSHTDKFWITVYFILSYSTYMQVYVTMYKREREVMPTPIWEHIPVCEQDTRGRGGMPCTVQSRLRGGGVWGEEKLQGRGFARKRGCTREGTKEGRGHEAEAEAEGERWHEGGCEGRAGCKQGRGREGAREAEREGVREGMRVGVRGWGTQRVGQVTMKEGPSEGEGAHERCNAPVGIAVWLGQRWHAGLFFKK